ncbi:short-chain dehydrogenase/reductase family 9C member 7-like [Amblyomma americanum]
MYNLTAARLTSVAAALLWLLALRIPWLLNLATNVGLLLLTLTAGYWLLWYAHRALFNGNVDPKGKCVLITGCDTGFGHMLAAQLAEEGFFVFAGCLDENGDGSQLLKRSKNIQVMQMDVTKEEDIAQAFQSVQDTLGDRKLWAVVANAGVGCIGYIEWQPLSRVRSVFDVNTFGVLSVCTMFLPLLKKARGRLVLVTSLMGRMTLPECLAYCMSKTACTTLADGLRRQYFNRGIHVCTVEPVAYRTRMMDHASMEKTFDSDVALLPESVRSAISERSVAKSKHTAQVLHSFITRDQPQEAVDAMKLAVRERLPRSSYKPGGLWNNVMRWLYDIGPTEMVDDAIDAARRLAALTRIK